MDLEMYRGFGFGVGGDISGRENIQSKPSEVRERERTYSFHPVGFGELGSFLGRIIMIRFTFYKDQLQDKLERRERDECKRS